MTLLPDGSKTSCELQPVERADAAVGADQVHQSGRIDERLHDRTADILGRHTAGTIVEEALATAGQLGQGAVAVGDEQAGIAAARDIDQHGGDGAGAVRLQSWTGRALPDAVDEAAEQDGDVVGALVGDDHVGNAVAVDVRDGDRDRIGADGDRRSAARRSVHRSRDRRRWCDRP